MEERNSIRTVQAAIDDAKSVIRTPWLARTQWLERYVGIDMVKLVEMTERPKTEEWMLNVWNDVGAMVERTFDGIKDVHGRSWDRILYWLASPNRETISKDPMNFYLKAETVERYASYWQRFLCFCLRAMDEELQGVKFTEEQTHELNILRELYVLDENRMNLPRLKRKQNLICSIRFIKQTVFEVGLPVLVYYSGILGFNKEGGTWRQPEHYTNILAGILWCMRVLVLEYALPTGSRDRLAQDEITPLQRFKLVRDEFLVEETECPFATLHTLMNYGFIVGKDAIGNTGVNWSADGEVLYIRGNEIRMTDWKRFLHELMLKAEEKLGRVLLFRADGTLPNFNLWEVEDNQALTHIGYYFGRRDEEEWTRVRKEMLQRNRDRGDRYGLIERDNHNGRAFVQAAVDEYKRVETEFREMLYILMLGTCGPPPRVTEMTSIKYMNSREGSRNIFVMGGQVMLVTEYHKSQSIMKKQKVLPY